MIEADFIASGSLVEREKGSKKKRMWRSLFSRKKGSQFFQRGAAFFPGKRIQKSFQTFFYPEKRFHFSEGRDSLLS